MLRKTKRVGAMQTQLSIYRRLARGLRELSRPVAPPEIARGALERVAREIRTKVRGQGADVRGQGVRFSSVEAGFGRIYLAYSPSGIRFVAPAESPEAFAEAYEKRFNARPQPDLSSPERLLATVRSAMQGDRRASKRLRLDLDSLGSFEQAVLKKALEIPRGEVRTYGWVAREIGFPHASRAVGRALGRNPIPFLIPCHRVVGSSGALTGYAFGIPLKQRVLLDEGLDALDLKASEQRGERFRGCRSTRIFCFPSCRYARKVQPRNVVPFRNDAVARLAGYRPCKVCRPAEALA